MAECWVRVIAGASTAELEHAINAVIDEAERTGAELVDIKLTSTAGAGLSGHGGIGSTPGAYVALVILRAPSGDRLLQQTMIT